MKRTIYALISAAMLASMPVFAQTTATIGAIQAGASTLVETLATALPFNSTVGLNWSDAYIGQLLSVPPHFGVGVTVGATSVKAAGLTDLLSQLGVPSITIPAFLGDKLPLPVAVAEARIGGFLLPFDVGVKAGFIPDSAAASLSEMLGGLKVNYLAAGADIRLALVQQNILLPSVIIGVGVNYMKGGLGKTLGSDLPLTYTAGSDTYNILATAPNVGLTWESTVFDLKAQVSKSLLIFTPYLGAGASYGMTKAGYKIESTVTYDKNGVPFTDTTDLINALTSAGIAVPDLTASGITYQKTVTGFTYRAYGGLSINILVLKLDVTGLYNFSDGSIGASVGARIQL
ncbi:MAG: hypothetical protein WCT14_20390 [Treponemataceae bacterium]